jgi:putative ABC transport system permease protein
MGKILLICRLAARDLRRRPAQAGLLLLVIMAATATLTLGLALRGVASQPYEQTRAAANGPDLVATIGVSGQQLSAQVTSLLRTPGVTGHSGPYPQASAIVRAGSKTAVAVTEGRDPAPAPVDQPALTQGSWVRPGGVVIERAFADALGVSAGDRITLGGRPFTVAGIAVTAASPPYPDFCEANCYFGLGNPPAGASNSLSGPGLIWLTQADARTAANGPLTYVLNLTLADPASAQAFANAYDKARHNTDLPGLTSWQDLQTADAFMAQDAQRILTSGSWVLGILALATVAVLVAGRTAERTRRVGLLKAVGGTPGLVAAVLLAENLVLALAAAGAGLGAGWLAAPLITSPGAGLVGTPGAPSLTLPDAVLVVVVALAVALAATFVPAIRAARTSTVSALADAARPPRRRAWVTETSARLPVPLLLGIRLAARRPRRAALSAASIAVTVAGIVAVLAYHAHAGQQSNGGSGGLANPLLDHDQQILLMVTAVLGALAVLNAIVTAWATALDARHSSALARALGATPQQVAAGISAAQALPALPGAMAGIPLGLALFGVASSGGGVTVPPAWWLAAAVLGTLLTVAMLAAIPARAAARRPAGAILQSETT